MTVVKQGNCSMMTSFHPYLHCTVALETIRHVFMMGCNVGSIHCCNLETLHCAKPQCAVICSPCEKKPESITQVLD